MFNIDPMSRTPVYEQIIEQTEKMIALGILKAHDPLPSVRNLSVELSINPNTVQKTFSELYSRGLIVSVPGRGSFISDEAAEIVKQKSRSKLSDLGTLVRELYIAGVSEDDIIAAVRDSISEICVKQALSPEGAGTQQKQKEGEQ